jgi:asparagine synthetase B (glutamine-hydrolysing)
MSSSSAEGASGLAGAAALPVSWTSADGHLGIDLDGEILEVDGHATRHRGSMVDDLSAVARLFEELGEEAWTRLDGSFFMVVRVGGVVHAGVDAAGTRARYWWHDAGRLAFHSRFVDLAPSCPAPPAEDWGAIACYLAGGLYPPGRTALVGIGHLGAGQHLVLDAAGLRTGRHVRMIFDQAGRSVPTAVLVDGLIERIEAAVALRWRAAESPIVPLSGGLDSRYLAAELARQAGPAAVLTLTWGEEPARPDSDASIASLVAAALGVRHGWREKHHEHTPQAFEEAIRLSSGEVDIAIHFPGDRAFHRALRDELGVRSLFRGDECFGLERLVTDHAVAILAGVARLSETGGYAALLPGGLLTTLARESDSIVEAALDALASATPTGRRDELWYEFGVRRFLAPYNALKALDLEVHLPFLDQQLLAWLRRVPDELRGGKRLVRLALERRFPEVAAIPYATRDNLPNWERRTLADGSFAGFLRDWFDAPGWIDDIGARHQVQAVVDALAAGGSAGTARGRAGNWRATMRRLLARTRPGMVALEMALGHRAARNALPGYLRLARLAVIHGLLGMARAPKRDAASPVALVVSR